MSKRVCAQCGTTKFGLIAYRRGFLKFCSRKCLDKYVAALASRVRWFKWLAS